MQRHLDSPSPDTTARLRELLARIEAFQNTYQPGAWGDIRIITSVPLLIIEHALRCLLAPGRKEAALWAYQAGRYHAERYDPRFPSGLVPASAPKVEQIADFWCRHHLGQSLTAWMASSSEAHLRAPPRASPPARGAHRAAASEQAAPVSKVFPAIARWVAGHGCIEIGETEGSRSFVRALDEGGLIWEGKPSYPSLDAALRALDRALARWLREET